MGGVVRGAREQPAVPFIPSIQQNTHNISFIFIIYFVKKRKRIEKRGGHIKQYAAAQQQHSHLLNYFPFELDF
jgi:hypothetical protein